MTLTRDELIEKALAYWESLTLVQPVADLEVAQAMADFAAQAREEAIDECARACEEVWVEDYIATNGYRVRSRFAKAIRALRAPSEEQRERSPDGGTAREKVPQEGDTAINPGSSPGAPTSLRQRAEELLREHKTCCISERHIDAMLAFGEEREEAARLEEGHVCSWDAGFEDGWAKRDARARQAPALHSDADTLERAAEILERDNALPWRPEIAADIRHVASQLRARSAPPAPDWAEAIASRALSGVVEAARWVKTRDDLAALLRERFGECVAHELDLADLDDMYPHIAKRACNALARLRGEKEAPHA